MPTPIEALSSLIRKIEYCNKCVPRLVVLEQPEYKIACAVVSHHSWVGRAVSLNGSDRTGRLVEVVDEGQFLCVFDEEKMTLAKNQFSFIPERACSPLPILPIPMILNCPECGERHIDSNGWEKKVHTTHACQHCGMVWRPALVPTVGVQFLPGYKNDV